MSIIDESERGAYLRVLGGVKSKIKVEEMIKRKIITRLMKKSEDETFS